MVRRDDVIRMLSANLHKLTENHESLQAEYMTQASQLVEQVHTLQEQLKQVPVLQYLLCVLHDDLLHSFVLSI